MKNNRLHKNILFLFFLYILPQSIYSQFSPPVARFELSAYQACAPFGVAPQNKSQNATKFHWDFGNGNTSDEKNPVFVYALAGNYTITLEDNMLSGSVEVFLYDQLPTPHSFQTNVSYPFNYQTPGEPRTFGLVFAGTIDIESLDDEVLVNIYSNSDKIYVVANNQIIDKIELYNVTGEKILNQTINSSQATIQTNLPQGVYIVKAIVEGEVYTAKIVL